MISFIHDFLYENLNFLYENLRFSVSKIFMTFSMIFLMIHKIFFYKVIVSTGGAEARWLGWQFLDG